MRLWLSMVYSHNSELMCVFFGKAWSPGTCETTGATEVWPAFLWLGTMVSISVCWAISV